MTITITAHDEHFVDGKLTFSDSKELASIEVSGNRSLRIEEDRVVLGPRVLLRRTPSQHERAHDHPWRATGKDDRLWTRFSIEVS